VKSRAFWTLQIAGWLAFVAALMVPWLDAFPLRRMLWNKLPLIVTGFAVTVALRFAYRRFLQRGAPIWLLAVAGVAGSWLGSLAWSAAAALIVQRTGVGAIERGTLRSRMGERADGSLSRRLAALLGAGFLRIHRSAIVNAARIRELRPQPNGEFVVVLHSGAELRASRGYADRLRAAIGDPL